MESALEQMRAVGITDAELSRRALTMSEGNVEAAINLIFEGSLWFCFETYKNILYIAVCLNIMSNVKHVFLHLSEPPSAKKVTS